jgi:hypothetical protein
MIHRKLPFIYLYRNATFLVEPSRSAHLRFFLSKLPVSIHDPSVSNMQRQTPRWGIPSCSVREIDQWLIAVNPPKRSLDDNVEVPPLDLASKRPKRSSAPVMRSNSGTAIAMAPFLQLPRASRCHLSPRTHRLTHHPATRSDRSISNVPLRPGRH